MAYVHKSSFSLGFVPTELFSSSQNRWCEVKIMVSCFSLAQRSAWLLLQERSLPSEYWWPLWDRNTDLSWRKFKKKRDELWRECRRKRVSYLHQSSDSSPQWKQRLHLSNRRKGLLGSCVRVDWGQHNMMRWVRGNEVKKWNAHGWEKMNIRWR